MFDQFSLFSFLFSLILKFLGFCAWRDTPNLFFLSFPQRENIIWNNQGFQSRWMSVDRKSFWTVCIINVCYGYHLSLRWSINSLNYNLLREKCPNTELFLVLVLVHKCGNIRTRKNSVFGQISCSDFNWK